jgi:RND family efflux transporter MFP subunit
MMVTTTLRACLLAFLFVVVVGLGILGGCGRSNEYVEPPPPEVMVSQPLQRRVIDYMEYTGRTEAIKTVDVRARVTGFLESVHFVEGARVARGDLLFVIDPKPFEATLNRAQADLERKESTLTLARAEFARTERLYQQNAVPEAEFDQARAARDTAQADVAAARAAVETARLDLGYTRVQAPVSGRIGQYLVDVGNLVGAGDYTHLATITTYDPMYVHFSINERDLLQLMQKEREQALQGREAQDDRTLELGFGESYFLKGRMDFYDLGVDPETGTFLLRGVFPNAEDPPHLLPGLFVRIRHPINQRDNALLMTERALGADQGGRYLLVVNQENQVERRPVRVGALVDGMRVIEEGLQADEWVVVNGLQRARPGITVTPQRQETVSTVPETIPSAASRSRSLPNVEGLDTLDKILREGRLVAVVQLYFEPFSFTEGLSQRVGFEVDLLREFARRWLGDAKAVTFAPVTSARRIPTLLAGEADLIAAALTKTPARRQQIAFSQTYFQDGQRLLVQESADIDDVCDLDGLKIAVIRESTAVDNVQRVAADCGFTPKLVLFDDHASAVHATLAGDVAAFSTDGQALEAFAQDQPLKVVGNHFSEEPYGIGVRKGDERLLQLIDLTLHIMVRDGTLAALYHKWFGDRIRPYPMPADAPPVADPQLEQLAAAEVLPVLPPAPERPAPPETYVVQPGDSLSIIAGKVYGDVSPAAWRLIYKANQAAIGANPSNLRVGMELTIPEL